MTALDLEFVRTAARKGPISGRIRSPAKIRSLDKMTILQMARRTVIFTVDASGIASLMDAAREDIPGLTSNQIVQAVANHNPDTFWAIAKKDQFDIACPRGEGFLAVLPLTHEGTRRLVDGRLDTRNPDMSLVTRQSERPAGIYVWAIHAKGATAAAIPLVLQKFSTPLYQGINIYSRPITKEGLRVLEPLGFSPRACFDGIVAPHLQMLDRSDEAPAGEVRSRDSVSVRVVRSTDEMARVIALRSAVYIGEQVVRSKKSLTATTSPQLILSVTREMSRSAACASDISPISPSLNGWPSAMKAGMRGWRAKLLRPPSNSVERRVTEFCTHTCKSGYWISGNSTGSLA